MLPNDFEGVEEQRKTWCQNRMISLREWVKSYGRSGLVAQLEAAMERIAGLESLLREKESRLSKFPVPNEDAIVEECLVAIGEMLARERVDGLGWSVIVRITLRIVRPWLHQYPPQVNIEAGAIACSQWVYGSNHGKPSWDRLSEEHKNQYREQAKACARVWGLEWK